MAQIDNNVAANKQAEAVNTAPQGQQEQQNAAPAPVENNTPAEPEKEKKEHPKWDAFKTKAKKVGKYVGLGAAVVGGLFVANKLGKATGKAEGYDAAMDALKTDPVPELPRLEDASAGELLDMADSLDGVEAADGIEITQF